MRRFITASDVEILTLTGQKILYVDEEDIVTSVAREMAAKLGVVIVEGPPPEKDYKAETKEMPKPEAPQHPKSPKVWVPSELNSQSPEAPVKDEKKERIILKNGMLVWPGQGTFKSDLVVSGSKIVSVHHPKEVVDAEEIDVTGKYILPGIVDPHVHLGIYSPFDQDARDETKAGLWGGVTTIGCFLYDKESYLPKLEHVSRKVKELSYTDIFFHLTISTEEHLKELPNYINEYGIRSFKIYMCGVPGIIPDIDDGFMRRVYEKLAETGQKCTVCIHAENASLVRWATEEIAAKNGMKTSIQEWSETHPVLAEEEAIHRVAFLTREFEEISTYFVHVSSKEGIEAVSKIKCDVSNIYAETTSPYLLFTIEGAKGNIPKWLPPLRDKESQEALWKKLKQGKIDSLGTDSVPVSPEVKGIDTSVWEAMPNLPSMEFHLAGILTEGMTNRKIQPDLLVDLMTRKPAELFGFFPKKGSLFPGADADVVVVDMQRWQKVEREKIKSSSLISLFEGKMLTGWPAVVIKGGTIVIKDGEWVNDPPPCQVLNEARRK